MKMLPLFFVTVLTALSATAQNAAISEVPKAPTILSCADHDGYTSLKMDANLVSTRIQYDGSGTRIRETQFSQKSILQYEGIDQKITISTLDGFIHAKYEVPSNGYTEYLTCGPETK